MKKLLSLLLVTGLLAALPASSDAKTFNLRFTSSAFEQHPSVANGLKPWFKDVEKATDGQVKIRYFGPNTICPVQEISQSIVTGSVDMGTSNHNANSGMFPAHDLFFLPMIAPTTLGEGLTGWEIYKKNSVLQKEMENYKVLGYWGGGVLHVFTNKKPIRKLEDLKGMRLLGLNKGFADIIKALGAEPIIVPFPDVYMAMSRNQADGALWSFIATPAVKMNEFTKYVTEVGLSSDLRFIGMNKKVWDNLGPDLQKKFESVSDPVALNKKISLAMEQGDLVGIEALKKAGCEFIKLSAEERERWVKAISPLHDVWVNDMVKRNLFTEEEARALLKETLKTSAEIQAKRDNGTL